MTDDAALVHATSRDLTIEPLQVFDDSDLESEPAPYVYKSIEQAHNEYVAKQIEKMHQWTPEMENKARVTHRADRVQRLAQFIESVKRRLFTVGLDSYVTSLTESQVLTQLKILDPDEWTEANTRYTTSTQLRSALAQLLYEKEIKHGT